MFTLDIPVDSVFKHIIYSVSVDSTYAISGSKTTVGDPHSPVWAIESPSREYISDIELVNVESGPPPLSQPRGHGTEIVDLV